MIVAVSTLNLAIGGGEGNLQLTPKADSPPVEKALGSSAKVCSDEYFGDQERLPILALSNPSLEILELFVLRTSSTAPYQEIRGCGSADNFNSWYWNGTDISSGLGPFTSLSVGGNYGEAETIISAEFRDAMTNAPHVLRWIGHSIMMQNATRVDGGQPSGSFSLMNPRFPFIAFQRNRTDGGSSILLFKSEDFASHFHDWTVPYEVVGRLGSSPSRNETPAATADALDNLHIAYLRSSGGNRDVYYIRNTHRGDDAYWEAEPGRRLSWNATDNHDIAIATSREGGTVLVTWTATNSTGNDDLLYAYSLDGGNTFSMALNLSATVFNEGYDSIAIDVETSTFHVAYWSNDSIPGRTNNIFWTQASWGDPGNWTVPQSVLDLGAVASPDFRRPGVVAYSPGGNHTLDVSWTDSRNPSNLDIYMTNVSLMSCEINVNPRSGPVPLNVLFSASASGGIAPYTYTWRLGDGTMGGGPFGAHTYNTAGDYNVAMRVDDAVGNTCFRAVRIRALQIIPDLSVSPSDISFSPPPPQVEWTVIQVNATIRNVGGADSMATNARFFDGAPPSPQIGSDKILPPIPVNGSANVSVMWTASPPGDHEICVVADPDNQIAEIDETNNMACAVFRVLSLADLTPISMDVTPPSPLLEGTLARVDATIANGGDLPAGAFDVLLFDDRNSDMKPEAGENISLSPLSGVAGHSQENASFDWTPSLVGDHALCAYADPPPGTVSESGEANNVICIDVLVQPSPVLRPDYVPVSPLPLPPIRVGMSSQVSISVQVLNQGNGTATDNTIIAFRDQSSPPFSTLVVNPLAPAATSSRFTATWTSPAMPDTYSVSVDVDYDNNISEWDETNNVYTWTIEVVSGPLTSLVIGNPNYTSPAIVTYVRSTTLLDFSVLDQSGLGIRNTTYTIDGGSPVNYTATGTFFLPAEGVHTIEWRSLDWAGNLEDVSSMDLIVDDTPPATAILIGEPKYLTGGIYVNSSTPLTLSAIDGGVGSNSTFYRLWDGTWTQWREYSTTFNLAGRDGTWYVEFLSFDYLGNMEALQNETLILDDTPPVTTISPAVPFTLAATDSGCGLNVTMYRIDSGSWTVYTGNFALSEGEHTIYYYSIDNLGNVEQERSLVVRPPVEVEVNYKPIVALIFAVILLVAGVWSSKRRPWKGGKDSTAVVKALIFTSMPFVAAEAATGVISFLTGELSIPPVVGVGMAVDCTILILGLVVLVARAMKKKTGTEEAPAI